MTLFDIYVQRESVLHRVDPRVKILGAIFLTVLCFFLTNILILVVIIIFLLSLIASTRTRWRAISPPMWVVARLAIMFILIWPFFDQIGEPVLLDLPLYKVTLPALLRSVTLALRLIAIASAWLILMLTTRQGKLVRGFVRLGLPYDLGLSISIALRYIPTLMLTMEQIKEAQMSRGLDIDRGGPIRNARNFVPVLIPTITRAVRTAEGLSLSLESRGYGTGKGRTYYREIRMRAVDMIAITSIIAAVLSSIALDIIGVISI